MVQNGRKWINKWEKIWRLFWLWLFTLLIFELLFWLMWWYLLSLNHSAKKFDWFSNVPILRPFFVGSAPRLTPYRSPEGGGARELSPADAVSLPGATTKAPLQAWKPVWSFPLHREELGCNKLYGFPRRGFGSEWMKQSRIESSPAYQAKLHGKKKTALESFLDLFFSLHFRFKLYIYSTSTSTYTLHLHLHLCKGCGRRYIGPSVPCYFWCWKVS